MDGARSRSVARALVAGAVVVPRWPARLATGSREVGIIRQPRPEERAPEVGPARLRHLKKDRNRQQPISIARVSKDGCTVRTGCHPSRCALKGAPQDEVFYFFTRSKS